MHGRTHEPEPAPERAPADATRTPETPHSLLRLQRSAGNRAVAARLSVQRVRLDLPSGGQVGDGGAANGREAVVLILDRLHVMWALTNAEYDSVYASVTALPTGAAVTDRAVLAMLQTGLTRLEVPVLPVEVANARGLPISAGVGPGQPNAPADVRMIQGALRGRELVTPADLAAEPVPSSGPVNIAAMPHTLAGITALKRAITAGTGRIGWDPIIHADEAGPGGRDRLADRTFSVGEFMVFVPTPAAASPVNNVHVFWSAANVQEASSHPAHHGLRGAAEGHGWILVAVQGAPGRAFTISTAQISACLAAIGRSGTVASVRMSAHSRGNAGMATTLSRRLIDPGLIDHVTVLDGSDHARMLTSGFRASRIPASRITADFVTTGAFSSRPGALPRVRSLGIPPEGIRAIGYARLIADAEATGRVTAVPAAVASRVHALALPPRGSFSAEDPVPAGKTGLRAFIGDPANRAALRDLLSGEGQTSNVGRQAARVATSPYSFVEWNNLLNINDPGAPRSQWRSVAPGIYSHHLFVAEVADDLFR